MDELRLMAIKAAGAGFAGGDPAQFLRMPVDWALDIRDTLRFREEYEATRYVLNEKKGKS